MSGYNPFETTHNGTRYRYDQARNKIQKFYDGENGWFDDDAAPVYYTTEGWATKNAGEAIANPFLNQNPLTVNPNTGQAEHHDPYHWWETSDPHSRSWRYFDDATKSFYNDNKQAAYGQYLDDQIGTNLSPLRAYMQQNYQRAVQEYYRQNESNPQLMFTDTLNSGFLDSLRQSFYSQSPGNKGYNLQWLPQGRYTG